ncbi:MAG TPA: 2-amino-4-hydroxy-6-hydroxymethyldihydropteridine diphosphokinase [Chloroflexota bacterium]
MDRCQEIEQRMGRVPSERWGPRVIDIDLLLYANLSLQTDRLVLPHPQLWNRRFVLVPLTDVAVRKTLRDRVGRRLAALPERPTVVPYRPTSKGRGGP